MSRLYYYDVRPEGREGRYTFKTAFELKYYMRSRTEEQKVISLSEKAVFNAAKNHGSSLGLDLNPHALRKWCITFWSRKGDQAMLNFVSRHKTVNLEDRYVAPLTLAYMIFSLFLQRNQVRFLNVELLVKIDSGDSLVTVIM